MGRKSKLTEEQWTEIGKRLLEGEGPSALAREFGVGESTIRSRFERKGQKTKDIQKVAAQIFDAEKATKAAERALQTLEPTAQYAAMSLAAKMRSISESLAAAADNSAKTALRLTALANDEAQKIDDADPIGKTRKAVEGTVLLQKAAREAADIPISLLSAAANRDLIRRLNDESQQGLNGGDEILTPERVAEGVRRMAFTLQRAARAPKQPQES